MNDRRQQIVKGVDRARVRMGGEKDRGRQEEDHGRMTADRAGRPWTAAG